MTCFNPKYAFYQYRVIKNKKGITNITKDISFTTKEKFETGIIDNVNTGKLIIPCGKCIGCVLDKSKSWGLRGLLESKQWKNNCFITLTYNNENLKDKNLNKKDIQLFLKKLRKQYSGIESRIWKNKEEYPIRYFYSGEYGPLNLRPHFHIGIFNWKPPDMKLWKISENGDSMYTSEIVSKIWGKGFILIEDMNYNTAQYIGRYTTKKAFGKEDEIIKAKGLKKEFIETSRRGGIAYQITEQPEEWEKMKRNFGFFTKNRKGIIKLEKIPQFIKNKWKEFDRLEYFEESDKHRLEAEKAFEDIIKQTDLNRQQYLKVQKNTLLAKLKNAKSLRRNKTEKGSI